MNKLINFFKYFWVTPLDDRGGFKFQIKIPIGKKYGKEDSKYTIK